ncbi:LysR family transcriptional regulator [Kaistia sp. 32K]|uniref:LysR family transcriptional regulator n=1 Tax=Kaistia sp. 32K TaxID=2795690 RepID=UPI001915D9F4|nr:LysR family transcriptional regulator [Kaistia sp. 32K]BCP52247.1 LysR family transcriptional regulator [Kaistia sp. 32K]
MDIDHLRLLRELARHKSVSGAAGALGLTQSTASKQLLLLEKEAGRRLAERSWRGASLTPDGERLLAHAEIILDQLDLAAHELQSIADRSKGAISLAAFDGAVASFVPTAIRATSQRIAGAAVKLVVAEPGAAEAAFGKGEVDVGLVLRETAQAAHSNDGRTRLQPLFHENLLCAVPSGHPIAARAFVELADVDQEAWAFAAIDGCPLYAEFFDACSRAGFEPECKFLIEDLSTRLGVVASGAAFTIIPELMVSNIPEGVALRPFGNPIQTVVAAVTSARPSKTRDILVEELINAANARRLQISRKSGSTNVTFANFA